MVLAKSGCIAHRNISGIDGNTIVRSAADSASIFYSVENENLRLLLNEKPMLLPIMLFNVYDVYVKGKKEIIEHIDSTSDLSLKKRLNEINLGTLDALRRSDAIRLRSVVAELKGLIRSENISKSALSKSNA